MLPRGIKRKIIISGSDFLPQIAQVKAEWASDLSISDHQRNLREVFLPQMAQINAEWVSE